MENKFNQQQENYRHDVAILLHKAAKVLNQTNQDTSYEVHRGEMEYKDSTILVTRKPQFMPYGKLINFIASVPDLKKDSRKINVTLKGEFYRFIPSLEELAKNYQSELVIEEKD